MQTGAVANEHYHDSDLTIGGVVNVWGRWLLLCDCDEFTKEYYRSKYGIGECVWSVCGNPAWLLCSLAVP